MKKFKLMAAMAIVAFLAACNNDKGNGTLSVRLTDSPADYEEVLIDVQELQIHVADDTVSENGWPNLPLEVTGQIDLLKLANGKDTLLTEEELPSGKITQMRLILGDNNKIKVAGEYHDLETPSAQQSGLKLNINATIEEGTTYRMWLDFDVAKSVVEKGNGTYSLKPTIKVFTEDESGSISGVVTPADANLTFIQAVSSKGEVSGTYSDSDGKFVIQGLEEDIYKVIFTPQLPYNPTEKTNVSVTLGSDNNIGEVVVTKE